jgi:hypothetical protein
MNYQKVYNNIIKNAKSKNRIKLRKNQKNYIYYEKHHITPKCLGGRDKDDNLVLLTAKEHYVVHKLLTYIYTKNKRKLVNAFHRMTFDKNGNRKISSRDYEYAKFLKVTTPISEETRQKMRDHIFTDEHRKKLSESHKGLKYENRTLPSMKGMLNPFYNKKHSDETKRKMSESAKNRKPNRLGKKHSDETKRKMSESAKNRKNRQIKIMN